MVKLVRTDACHEDFIQLVKQLDAYLAEVDGEDHEFYDQYNQLDDIKHIILAYDDHMPVGCGAIKAYDDHSVEIKRMYTDPLHRGKGIASKILTDLETWAFELSYQYCVLETGKKQTEAIALYKKMGYINTPCYGQYAGVTNSLCFKKVLFPNQTDQVKGIFDIYAQSYAEKYMDVSLYKKTLDLFCQLLHPKPNLLELGCGPGNLSRYILNQRSDANLLGIDLAPKMIDLAKQYNPDAQFKMMDCRDINQLNQKFDGIILGFCLPYLSKKEAIQLIKQATQMLLPDGLIYLSTMEDHYVHSGFEKSSSGQHELFLFYHEADYLTTALETSGLSIEHLEKITYLGQNQTEVVDLVLLAKKIPLT